MVGGEDRSGPTGLSEWLTGRLLELIAERGLEPGDPLPPVRELAGHFAVTTPTLREALRRLQATDTVRPRHGSGVYVGPGIRRVLLANPNAGPLRDEAVLELVGARLAVEPGIAALAARERTDERLARLELACETARTEPGRTGGRPNFHRELAACSGNQVLYEIVDSLLTVRRREQRAVRALIDDRQRDHREHRAIFAAVRDREPELAERLTREHLALLRDHVAARLTPSPRPESR
jgi:GntR family transcriptional regulator, transcriptional repressor for pyruvate dehydrogenase complex